MGAIKHNVQEGEKLNDTYLHRHSCPDMKFFSLVLYLAHGWVS